MRKIVEWLMDLERIELPSTRLAQAKDEISLQWLEPLDGWLWFILLLIVPTYVLLIYRHEGGSVRSRIFMGCARTGVILFALLLLCRPALVHRRDRIEPSTVAIMVDQSASMNRLDQYRADDWRRLAPLLPELSSEPVCSRWELTQAILAGAKTTDPQERSMLAGLLEMHQLRLFRFAGSISEELDILDEGEALEFAQKIAGENPSGQETNIAESIEQVFDACIDSHLAGIVLLTDGQPTRDADWSNVTKLSTSRGTPIFAIPIGSPEPPVDLAVENLRADRNVYLGDRATVECSVREVGLPAGQPLEVLLRDVVSNHIYSRRTLTSRGAESAQNVELQFKPQAVGMHQLIVEVQPIEEELHTDNNAQQLRINVVDDKIKVLYVDGYPRYEYRYLKNTLLREPSIISSILLLSADRDFPQEGDEPIRRFPRDREELSEYDVILFGDVDPKAGWISKTQMELIVEFVNQAGGGFGLIAGDHHTPQRLFGTPLESLIPVELDLKAGAFSEFEDETAVSSGADAITGGAFRPQLTAAGRDTPMFRLLLDPGQTEQALQHLPQWFWFSAVSGLRPGAEVLLEHPHVAGANGPMPLVVIRRHGAGITFYQGSDDTWRWRRHRGEGFFDAYWIQVIRYLGRSKKFRRSDGATLRTHRNKIDRQTPVVVSLEFESAAMASKLPDNITASVRSPGGVSLDQVSLTRLTADSAHFQGSFVPHAAGQLEFVFDPELYALDIPRLSTLVEVEHRSLESRRPQANIQLVTELAEQTGGRVIQPWQAATIHEIIPDRKYIVPDDITETIWDSKLALILFVLLITAEWILRKLKGLT